MTDMAEFIQLLARMGLYEPLLAQHYEVNGRCPVCRAGSIHSGQVVWPCTIYSLAADAKKLHVRRGI